MTLEKADVDTLKAIRANADSGKLRFINVWATWCGPVSSSMSSSITTCVSASASSRWSPSLPTRPKTRTVKDFLTKKHASMKNYIIPADKKDAYFDALDPATVWKGELPYTLIVNEKGEVVYREHGALSFLKMRRAIVPELNRIKPWGGLSPIKPNAPPKTAAN